MSEELNCSSQCDNVIAYKINVEGKDLLQIGGLLVSKIDGICVKCGREFHWSVTDQLLKKILKTHEIYKI